SRIGMPSVGRFRSLGSGFFVSVPALASHATTPHRWPLQSTILIRATRSATSHSPTGLGWEERAGCAKAPPPVVSQRITMAAQVGHALPMPAVAGFVTL